MEEGAADEYAPLLTVVANAAVHGQAGQRGDSSSILKPFSKYD